VGARGQRSRRTPSLRTAAKIAHDVRGVIRVVRPIAGMPDAELEGDAALARAFTMSPAWASRPTRFAEAACTWPQPDASVWGLFPS
jgi:hypothetical protein